MSETKAVAGNAESISVFMGTVGSGGHLVWISGSPTATGTGLTTQAKGLQFAGILDETAVVGSYATVKTRGIFNITKGNGTAIKLYQGQTLWGSSMTAVCSAPVASGSAIGVAYANSSSDTGSVAVIIHGMVSNV